MIRINAIFESSFLQQVTRAAKEEHVSRSELIRKALTEYLERRRHRQAAEKRRAAMAGAFRVQDGLREKSGNWDGTEVIRRWRDAS